MSDARGTGALDEAHLRPAGRATRDAIAAAARAMFAEGGFDGVSVRAIAAEAGVDPALVIRHFGSKEALFLRTLDSSGGVGRVVEGPIETLGRALVAYFLGRDGDRLRRTAVALGQASHRPQIREELVRVTARLYVEPIAPRLSGEHRELRAALVAAQLNGLLEALFVVQHPILTEASREALVATYGDAIQELLTPGS